MKQSENKFEEKGNKWTCASIYVVYKGHLRTDQFV